jgi:hypothetical protein
MKKSQIQLQEFVTKNVQDEKKKKKNKLPTGPDHYCQPPKRINYQ